MYFIPWIYMLVTITGCEINHNNIVHTDKHNGNLQRFHINYFTNI